MNFLVNQFFLISKNDEAFYKWLLIFGIPGIAAYVGYHDASGGAHD
ncbi:hypothetical protein U6A24_06290 [Aquimarina gracilis]|uniref:Uncharacterized protein n=1 Tax=Aquimarina gracilis TaxID=874422 RepID=A0ABU5ZSM6_9FLAO|nr:hypothetical protein [Aquimarina gracilis]MEB3345060.1 hypothetical protein [Aquimarina gracilis]